ncbi:sulfur carrier protein ThiS [Ruminiclostridium hungatei]|uniref:Sulfur carrier protein ThiS n=1 Tax=Ruminiclostridium hungatei TaxID=48256 RepID=A0A1V4SKR7_RUMHU|nr:sulfur carrier protein ThiS [Ruminiclostridium hungatei]OPX44492.1 sulfur carrier protein ThiS [Ruminiclostridium hungatei]
MKLNGQYIKLEETQHLDNFLKASGYNIDTIAVELNGEIIPKSVYCDTLVDDAAEMEVVRFVGGG